jgi:thiamine pyrophosphate-dependent acetolactate synthase large subunit-like protein
MAAGHHQSPAPKTIISSDISNFVPSEMRINLQRRAASIWLSMFGLHYGYGFPTILGAKIANRRSGGWFCQ